MIKIKLCELEKHRNECAFRPYLWCERTLRDIGIEFTTGSSYDYAWVAQASIINKSVSLEESVEKGIDFVSKITGDYMILDGQDSTSLMGTYEVFKESKAKLLLKNSLLKDRSLYKQGWELGRHYWGPGDYKLEDFDKYSDRIVLSGTNWLATHWAGVCLAHSKHFDIYNIRQLLRTIPWEYYGDLNWQNKKYDISAMFQYPSTSISYEHGFDQSKHYDRHRTPIQDVLSQLSNYDIAKLENGKRVSSQEYHNRISNAKIVLAPYGYGEMAPRDIEAAQFGAILIKPDMSYLDTFPNPYINGETYLACNHDYSDLKEKVDLALSPKMIEKNYAMVNKFRETLTDKFNPENIAEHVYKIFKNLDEVTEE